MTGTSINFGGVVVHVRRCEACDGEGRDFGQCAGGVWLKCDYCVEGLIADEDCGCEACAAHLCMEHYGEVRERCETCLELKANEVMRGFWAALRETTT